MPWTLLLDLRVWLAALALGAGAYAAVQRLEKEHVEAKFAQYRADAESEAAKAKVKAAQEAAQQAQHAQEALDDLSSRNAALSAAYDGLLHAKPGSRTVPRLSSAAPVVGTCPREPSQPDPVAGRMEQIEGAVTQVLERGDKEITKFVELYRLEQANAARGVK